MKKHNKTVNNSAHTRQKVHTSKSKTFIAVIFALVFAVIGSTALYIVNAAPKNRQKGVNMSLQVSSSKAAVGDTVTVTVLADAGSRVVNAVQSNISYNTDDLEFVSVDVSNSAFSIGAESIASNGVVRVARGNQVNLTGELEVAKITFKTLQKSRNSPLSFTSGTALIDSTTNQDALDNTYGTKLNIR